MAPVVLAQLIDLYMLIVLGAVIISWLKLAERPALAVAAARTGEALRPPEPVQIVEAIRIGPEPRLELTHRPRIVLSSARLLHTSSLLRLNGYPHAGICRDMPGYAGYAGI